MITHPGLPGPEVGAHLSFDASLGQYAIGTEFTIGRISMVSNTGTYLDTPVHRFRDGHDLSALPLHRCVDLPAVVIDGVGPIGAAAFFDVSVSGSVVLLCTGWDRRWGTERYGNPVHRASPRRELRRWSSISPASQIFLPPGRGSPPFLPPCVDSPPSPSEPSPASPDAGRTGGAADPCVSQRTRRSTYRSRRPDLICGGEGRCDRQGVRVVCAWAVSATRRQGVSSSSASDGGPGLREAVTVVKGAIEDRDALATVTIGADTAFLLWPSWDEEHVDHVVSVLAANTLEWAEQIRTGDVVRTPFPDAGCLLVHERHLADVAVRGLLHADMAGRAFAVTGGRRADPA